MTEDDWDDRPSKSEIKRQVLAQQELAVRMPGLADSELERLGVSQRLRGPLDELRRMKPSGARNRQAKHCVKFMHGEDVDQIEAYLSDRQSSQVEINQRFHDLERWRDRLVNEGDKALQPAIEAFPPLDRQQLRQLVRDARREKEQGKPAGAGRKLFRYLRQTEQALHEDGQGSA